MVAGAADFRAHCPGRTKASAVNLVEKTGREVAGRQSSRQQLLATGPPLAGPSFPRREPLMRAPCRQAPWDHVHGGPDAVVRTWLDGIAGEASRPMRQVGRAANPTATPSPVLPECCPASTALGDDSAGCRSVSNTATGRRPVCICLVSGRAAYSPSTRDEHLPQCETS